MSHVSHAWRPTREIELIAGTPAGGGQDRPARALIRILQSRKLIDVPVKLTNIPGKGGCNGWDYLRQHAGDAHVLAISSPTLITNRQLGVADFDHAALTPLANLYTEYIAFVVRTDSPILTSADFMNRLARDTARCRIALATAIGTWRGVIGAAGLAPEETTFWEHALAVAASGSEWNNELARRYWANTHMDSTRTREFLDRERGVMAAMLRKLGLTYPPG